MRLSFFFVCSIDKVLALATDTETKAAEKLTAKVRLLCGPSFCMMTVSVRFSFFRSAAGTGGFIGVMLCGHAGGATGVPVQELYW